jgi:hypothetical protein
MAKVVQVDIVCCLQKKKKIHFQHHHCLQENAAEIQTSGSPHRRKITGCHMGQGEKLYIE